MHTVLVATYLTKAPPKQLRELIGLHQMNSWIWASCSSPSMWAPDHEVTARPYAVHGPSVQPVVLSIPSQAWYICIGSCACQGCDVPALGENKPLLHGKP